MIRLLQNARLDNDLEFDGFDLTDAGRFLPVPDSMVDIDDSRLSDRRTPPAASVTNEKVAATAEIEQSKLNLNGNIPVPWLGASETQAAQGDLVERVANRGVAGGYVALGSNGKLASSFLPAIGPGAGTVTKVALAMPDEFNVLTSELSGAGVLAVNWAAAPDVSILGSNTGTGPPKFLTLVPNDLLPGLTASKFTSGEFPLEFLPTAKALGVGHAPGVLPDTGDGSTGNPADYLGRDITWRTMELKIPYQPTLPNVQLVLQGWYVDGWYIKLFNPQPGSQLFYLITDPNAEPIVPEPFAPLDNPTTLLVTSELVIQAYAAKAGWNNSPMATLRSPLQPES